VADQLGERTEDAFDTKNTVRTERPIGGGKPAADEDESLLKMEKPEAAKRMLKDWDKSWKDIKRFLEQWKVNRARSEGYTGVQLVKKQDQQQAYIPTGAKKNVAGMNKASRLSRRIRATLFSDPPKPEAMPSRDDDQARDEAEVSTRVLEDLCSEGNLAFILHAGDAFDLGGDYGSGFIRLWVDETGGGWRPKQIQASPQALTPDDPFPVDPQTGQPKACDPINRYVTEKGEFTEDRADAARSWLPKLKDTVLTGKQVRFLPPDVRDLWEADGLMIGEPVSLGELEVIFPDLKKWTDERRQKLVDYRPQHFKDLLAPGQKDVPASASADSAAKNALVFVLTRYHVQSPLYPEGAYLIAAGEDEILHRSHWFDEEHGEPLDIPVTQFKQRTDEGNPYGEGNMTALGPGNELRSAMVGSELEHLDRFQNRQIFLPMTSTLQPQQLLAPTGTVLHILPGQEPKYEDIPDFPVVVKEMLQFASQDMDDEADLQQAGQGINPQGVKSAKHQEVILQQVGQAMSDLKQNTERGLVRGWRIMMQLVRAYYTVPQEISWFGDDGRYKVQHWTGADLGSTKDVRIAKGSFTQLTAMSKAQLANVYRSEGLLNPMEAEHAIEQNLGGVFGLEDNPHRLRVRRQIAQWNDGPSGGASPAPSPRPGAASGTGLPAALPAGGLPAMPQPQQSMGQPSQGALGQAASGPPMAPPNPYQQQLMDIFAPVPSDTEPPVAMLRMFELGRAMASTKFKKWDQNWQQGISLSYQAARQAAQIPDAKVIQGMQQELQQTKEQLQQAQLKLGEAHVSFTGKLADLDEGQTMALLQKEGIQVPPRMSPATPPTLDPKVELEHKTAVEATKIASDLDKHKATVAAEIEKERIRVAGKAHESENAHKRATELAKTPPPAAKPRRLKITRDKEGRVDGAEEVA
jgi:hypothetical protein